MPRFARALIAAALAVPGLALGSTWEIDSAHTSANFAVRHLMLSTVRGTLGPVTGTVTLDESDPTKSSVQASIDVKGIDTRNQKRDEHLRGPDFFDVATYPTITFTSTKVEKVTDTTYKVTGNLTMRGKTKPVTLDVQGTPTPLQDPFGKVRMGGSAATKLNRQDFGIAWSKSLDGGGVVVGDQVDVTIDIEVTKTQ